MCLDFVSNFLFVCLFVCLVDLHVVLVCLFVWFVDVCCLVFPLESSGFCFGLFGVLAGFCGGLVEVGWVRGWVVVIVVVSALLSI